jgi:hypothetical protein
MVSFRLLLAALAVDQVLAEQKLAKWRTENTFHVPVITFPLQFCVEGTLVVIRPGWAPPSINVAPPPTMAKPPCNWLKLPP